MSTIDEFIINAKFFQEITSWRGYIVFQGTEVWESTSYATEKEARDSTRERIESKLEDLFSDASSGVTDHGDLTGLSDDDHTQYILVNGSRDFTSTPEVNNNVIWHAGNDGTGSGLDADLLDGLHAAAFEATGTAASLIATHEAAGNPHPTYATDADLTAHEGAADPHTGYQKESEKGAANGYASLDGSTLVPDAQIPPGIARDSEVTAAISTHEAAADPHTGYLLESLFDLKGDTIGASADNTPIRIAAGTNKYVYRRNDSASSGIEWISGNLVSPCGKILNRRSFR